ncbi:slipin family protein [Neisseriaceae bacterium ESL0693]|nr:slipin family protein [Neisseriaceae bacterium ESL0693]
MLRRIDIKKNELALVFKNGEFKSIFPGGKTHFFWHSPGIFIKILNPEKDCVDKDLAEYLRRFCPDTVKTFCLDVCPDKNEIAKVYTDNYLTDIVLPEQKRMLWQGYLEKRVVIEPLTQSYVLSSDTAEELMEAKTASTKVNGLAQLTIARFTDEQIGLLFVDQQLTRVVTSAKAVAYCGYTHEVMLSKFPLNNNPIDEKIADALRNSLPDSVAKYCLNIEIGADDVGLLYEDNVLVEILPPGTRRLYWQNKCRQHLERINSKTDYTLPESLIQQLIQPELRKVDIKGSNNVLIAEVPAFFVGILNVDGKIECLLDAGISAYWRLHHDIKVELVDTRLQSIEISGQEILTKDKINLRINLIANWRYNDVLQAHAKLAEPAQYLYRELQMGLREAVGTRTLDELLENKTIIDEVVTNRVTTNLSGLGITTSSVGVKDIILPGDMKNILAQVVEAEKSAQANVIRRREETAATRSLLNTAKVMENNPVALRLKEMETLEHIAEKIDKISVVGGLDQILHGLINIKQ